MNVSGDKCKIIIGKFFESSLQSFGINRNKLKSNFFFITDNLILLHQNKQMHLPFTL